jgi:hypothetical protein
MFFLAPKYIFTLAIHFLLLSYLFSSLHHPLTISILQFYEHYDGSDRDRLRSCLLICLIESGLIFDDDEMKKILNFGLVTIWF